MEVRRVTGKEGGDGGTRKRSEGEGIGVERFRRGLASRDERASRLGVDILY